MTVKKIEANRAIPNQLRAAFARIIYTANCTVKVQNIVREEQRVEEDRERIRKAAGICCCFKITPRYEGGLASSKPLASARMRPLPWVPTIKVFRVLQQGEMNES